MAIVFIGMETSGVLRRAFQRLGHETYSCDLLPSIDGGEEMVMGADRLPKGRHIVGDVFDALDNMWANDLWPDFAIFHPDCTFLTGSAEWAYKDPDFGRYPDVGYHQRLKPGTLFGEARRQARRDSLDQVRRLMALKIRMKIIENPVGAISKAIRRPTQIVQPYEHGDDASKRTCLWMMDEGGAELPDLRIPVDPALRVLGRTVEWPRGSGKMIERWANQTDANQNRLPPSEDRWQARAQTFPGIAEAVAAQAHRFLS